jgi:nicotinate phosphoribosyltransferase
MHARDIPYVGSSMSALKSTRSGGSSIGLPPGIFPLRSWSSWQTRLYEVRGLLMNTPTTQSPGSALLTDFYQLTMMDAYYRLGMERRAVFEFSVRRLPQSRNFLVAAGLEQVLDYLESLHFTAQEIEWLASLERFSPSFLERLSTFRFTGDVCAMREGSVCFASEPILRIEAPLPEAQLVESRIVNLLHYQTLIASKAARCRLAAGDAQLIDFGMRRAHGGDAAELMSRASYMAGFDATATVTAARRFNIPVVGTMAHSFIEAHELEETAFRNFAQCHPETLTLLIDTYDIDRAAQRAARLANELRQAGVRLQGVRIDSGDLADGARRVRGILDAAGCGDIRIYVSGGVDEHSIAAMRAHGAPIDAYCVGTRLSVSEDSPALDCAYKLQEYAGRPCRKRSVGKETWPGARQVFRQLDPHGRICRDVIASAHEVTEGRALLQEVMVRGRRKAPSPPLERVREHCMQELRTLPIELRTLGCSSVSPTKVSQRQHELVAQIDQRST